LNSSICYQKARDVLSDLALKTYLELTLAPLILKQLSSDEDNLQLQSQWLQTSERVVADNTSATTEESSAVSCYARQNDTKESQEFATSNIEDASSPYRNARVIFERNSSESKVKSALPHPQVDFVVDIRGEGSSTVIVEDQADVTIYVIQQEVQKTIFQGIVDHQFLLLLLLLLLRDC
jgi:hypothetical protein